MFHDECMIVMSISYTDFKLWSQDIHFLFVLFLQLFIYDTYLCIMVSQGELGIFWGEGYQIT